MFWFYYTMCKEIRQRKGYSLTRFYKKKHHTFLRSAFCSGGDYRDRTGDLLHAMQALSQLS